MPALIAACLVSLIVIALLWQRQLALRRDAYIRSFTLPVGLFDSLRKRHPSLTLKECQLVAHGLRQFFLAYLKSGRQFVSMPSQVTDDLWHEFILHTRAYQTFCERAFGRFFHHTPAVVLSDGKQSNAGLRRCWWYACRDENIDPRSPTRLPLLFALDGKLAIAGGFLYVANCDTVRQLGVSSGSVVHCGGDFSSASVDGGTDGFGDSSSSDGGGDGGGGCGGGGGD
ncbi:MAG: hypothetical protein IPM01_28595 [Burkholderiaceae bacterium]|nr:hypothetical protein [Burkholderiaceae bacterium]